MSQGHGVVTTQLVCTEPFNPQFQGTSLWVDTGASALPCVDEELDSKEEVASQGQLRAERLSNESDFPTPCLHPLCGFP